MATINQIRASRQNGAHSRGPVTIEGKSRSAANSTKHGICSNAVVLNNETPATFEAYRASLIEAWQPADARELEFVIDIVEARWRLQRFTSYESAVLDLETDRMRADVDNAFEQIDEPVRATLAFNSLLANNGIFETLQKAMRNQHRIVDRAATQLLRLQRGRTGASTEIGRNEPEPQPEAAPPVSTRDQGNEPGNPPAASANEQLMSQILHKWMDENFPPPTLQRPNKGCMTYQRD